MICFSPSHQRLSGSYCFKKHKDRKQGDAPFCLGSASSQFVSIPFDMARQTKVRNLTLLSFMSVLSEAMGWKMSLSNAGKTTTVLSLDWAVEWGAG